MNPDRDSLREMFESSSRIENGTEREIQEQLGSFRTKSTLEELFENIRSDKAWLQEIAQRSYAHDNGFDKIVINTFDSPDRKLRLHVWDSSITPQVPSETNVHNHRWDFCSTVLCGDFRFEIHELADDGNQFEVYEYTPAVGKEYNLEHKGQQNMRKRFSGLLPVGTEYMISHDVIHRTYVNSDGVTATLMLQGPEQKPTTSVFSQTPLSETESRTVTKLSPSSVEDKLDTVLSAI